MAHLISDVHFGKNLVADMERFRSVVQESDDDLVVIAGDFVQCASSAEYELAGAFVRSLISMDKTVVVTPGNHDFAVHLGGGFYAIGSDRAAVAARAGRRRFKRHILEPILNQAATVFYDPEDGFDTITVHGDDVFVALRSSHRPGAKNPRVARIRKRQAKWAYRTLKKNGLTSGYRLHLVTHRSMWKDGVEKHGALRGRRNLETYLLSNVTFDSFIHGHNHRFVVQDRRTPKAGIPIRRISLPTMCTREGRPEQTGRAYVDWNPVSGRVDCISLASLR